MLLRYRPAIAGVIGLGLVGLGSQAHAQTAIYQRGYDAGVTGANLTETVLTTANVGATTFGRIFSLPVDGRIYAQPLYVPKVTIPGRGTHNVLYVATMNDSLYAFDADTPGAPLWAINYASLTPGAAAVPIADFVGTDSLNIAGPVGIESTPVIDPATSTMYFVTNTRELETSVFRLHAVDITTGAEKFGGPTVIKGSVTVGATTVTFDPTIHNQRASLTLAKGQVIVAFASHEDFYHYYGWVMSYGAGTLTQTGIRNTAPTIDHGGGIWQTGRPPVVDAAGFVYLFVGNSWGLSGSAVTADGVNNFSESVLKLDPAQGLKVVDYFTPANYQSLDASDQDMTSSGPTLVPGSNLILGGGKAGTMYLLNTQNLGQLHAGDTGAVQGSAISAGEIRGGPVFWARGTAAGGPLFYNWGAGDALKAFTFTGQGYVTTPAATFSGAPLLYPGGELALSANGSSNGILWAIINSGGDADHRVPPGELHAFDASNVSRELWKSTANAVRDDFGLMAKWVPPVVTNGKVYVATSSNQVVVYGVLPSGTTPLVSVWPPRQPALGGSADFVVKATTSTGASASATWSVAGLPPAAAATFSADTHGRTIMHVSLGTATPRGSYRLQVSAGSGLTQAALLDVPDTTAVKATAVATDSQDVGNPVSYATDGNAATFWHTQFQGATPGYPHQITIDLGSVQAVSGVSYLPRQDGCVNGTILKYEIHLSVDGTNWLEETTGGSFDYGPDQRTFGCNATSFPLRQSIAFPATNARYVNLVALSAAVDGQPWASAAEIQVYTAQGKVPIAGNYVLTARHSGQVATVSGNSAANAAPIVQSPYTSGTNQQWAIASAATAGYDSLTAGSTGKLFDISGASHANGAPLIQWPANGGTNQQFSFVPFGDGRGFNTIGNLGTAGMCLDVLNLSQAVGAAIAQWPCNSGKNQQWYLSPANPSVP